jgi:hypothetical protein
MAEPLRGMFPLPAEPGETVRRKSAFFEWISKKAAAIKHVRHLECVRGAIQPGSERLREKIIRANSWPPCGLIRAAFITRRSKSIQIE